MTETRTVRDVLRDIAVPNDVATAEHDDDVLRLPEVGPSPLLVDAWPWDFVKAGAKFGTPDVDALVRAGPPWAGFVMKVSQGLWSPSESNAAHDIEWLKTYWTRTREAAGERYGVTFFREGYHYAELLKPARPQAQFCDRVIERVGGHGPGDLPLWIDVEAGRNPDNATGTQISDWLNEFAEETEKLSGVRPILYGNVYLAEHGFTAGSGCGCPWLLPARYLKTLPAKVTTRLGYKLDELFGWQYAGTGAQTECLDGYPEVSPVAPTKADIVVVTAAGGHEAAMQAMRDMCAARRVA